MGRIVGFVEWKLELSTEVTDWYAGLSPSGAAAADWAFGLLATQGHQLRMPHARALGEGLFELRFTCENVARRVTYVFEPSRKVILLTTFRKQRDNERNEISRARKAKARLKKERRS